MEPEEKQLLLIDLCARLPYGLIVEAIYKDGEGWKTEDRKLKGIYEDGQVYVDCVYTNIENVRPYLRPIGTMTDSEKREYWECYHEDTANPISSMKPGEHKSPSFEKSNEYLKKKMFDYNGLIPTGIALEAPEDLY